MGIIALTQISNARVITPLPLTTCVGGFSISVIDTNDVNIIAATDTNGGS